MSNKSDMGAKNTGAGRPVSNIQVPAQTLKFWQDNYEVGDFTEINIKKSIGRPTIRNAFRGTSSEANIEKITAFYNEREKGKVVIDEKIKLAQL